MVDQTKWGIDIVQQKNKQKAFEDQKQMRVELAEFIDKCNTYELARLYDEYRRLRKK